MKLQRLAATLTLVNLLLLVLLLGTVGHLRGAAADDVAPVLRGRALQIVDDAGRVRASIAILPANPKVTMPSGKTQAETVLLRMIDENGRPSVKIGVSVDEAGLCVAGAKDPAYVVMTSDGTSGTVRLKDEDGNEKVVKAGP